MLSLQNAASFAKTWQLCATVSNAPNVCATPASVTAGVWHAFTKYPTNPTGSLILRTELKSETRHLTAGNPTRITLRGRRHARKNKHPNVLPT
jgi:hypothetical protein